MSGAVVTDVGPHRVVVGDVMHGAVLRCMDGARADVECPWPEDVAVALRQLASHDERRR